MSLARFDCSAGDNKAFCHANGVKTYPNVRLYNNGAFIEKYSGQRDTEHILDYISYKAADFKLATEGNVGKGHALPPVMGKPANAPPPMPQIQLPVPPPGKEPPMMKIQERHAELPQQIPEAPAPPSSPLSSSSSLSPRNVEKQQIPPQVIPPAVLQSPPSPNVPLKQGDKGGAAPKIVDPKATHLNASTPEGQQDKTKPPQGQVGTASDSSRHHCTFPPSTTMCTFSLGISTFFIVPFAAYKLHRALQLPKSVAPADPWPYMLDAFASCLIVAGCIRSGVQVPAYAEVGIYALAGAHIALLGAGLGILWALMVVSLVVLFMYLGVPAGWGVNAAAYLAAGIIFINRYVAERAKLSQVLPGGAAKGASVAGASPTPVFDLAALVIVARCFTSFVEVQDFGVVVYFFVLVVLHVFGSALFAGVGGNGSASDGAAIMKGGKFVD
ncbi:hypothetical protein BC830DRAFT_916724 [Chytriomyces sp. MP71]|nr:hypothetical protein BC830DRAFT_916724 [Chytriomyces sp. MP71]